MTQETSRLVLAVDSSQVRKATGELDNMGAAGKRTEQAADGMSSAFAGLRGVLAGLSAALVVRQVVQQADAYSNLNARLQLATKNSEAFAAAQTALFGIAQRTGTGLEQTSDLFGSLSRSTEALGVSQERVLGVTKTINEALVVSGTSAAGASAALIQLGQGFASGTLRGEELNSVLEQAPRLAKAIADGLGVTVGQLRQLGQDGKLTGEQVFAALEKSGGAIEREFSTLPLTVGRASTEAANALLKLIGTIDQTSGASQGLASVISGSAAAIAQFAEDIAKVSNGAQDVGILAEAFVVLRETLQVLGANVAFVLTGLGRDFGAIAAGYSLIAELLVTPPSQLIETARRNWLAFNAISEAVKADGAKARAELDGLERRLLGRQTVTPIGSENDPRRGRGFVGSSSGAGAPTVTTSGGASKISEAQRYLETLQKQLQGTKDLSVAETVLADIQAGRLGKVSEAQRVALLGVAGQIDAAKRLDEVLQEQARQEDEFAAALKRQAEAGRAVFEATRTPAELLANEIERLNVLLDAGKISWDTYARAQFAAQDAFDKATETTKEQVKETNDFARDLGLTFSSAFEDAVIGGNNLRGVLKGLADDLVRLVLRKSVTEPLANAIGGFISGGLSGARASGGPVGAGGSYLVGERGPEILRMGSQGGSITPNDKIGGNTYVTVENNSGGSVREERSNRGGDQFVRLIIEQAVAEVDSRIAGGGSTSKALQSRGVDMSGGLSRRR